MKSVMIKCADGDVNNAEDLAVFYRNLDCLISWIYSINTPIQEYHM